MVKSHLCCVDTQKGAQRGGTENGVLQPLGNLTHSVLHTGEYLYTLSFGATILCFSLTIAYLW